MNVLGIALIVFGIALVCGGFIFRTKSPHEETWADTGAIANIRPRLDEIGD